MKFCVVQPFSSTDFSLSDSCFQWMMDTLDQCDDSMDLIVLPEYGERSLSWPARGKNSFSANGIVGIRSVGKVSETGGLW